MFYGKALACLLAGVFGGAAIGGPAIVGASAKWGGGRLANTPLGKLITGNLGRLLVLKSELNVSDEQKEQIRKAVVAHKPEIAKAAQGVWQKRTALRDAVLAGKDEAAVRQAANELGAAIGDAAVLAAKITGQVRPMLTEEQRRLIQECRAECDQAVEKFFSVATKAE